MPGTSSVTLPMTAKSHFIGVWDTVASMGALWGRKYYRDNRLNPKVSSAYQALSIDERRLQFQPSIWDEDNIPEGQTIEQVWFAGRHVDVGGQDVLSRGLSDIPLLWMLEKAEGACLCLLPGWRDELQPDPCGPQKGSWSTSLWSFCLRKVRPIPVNAKIHDSVVQRLADSRCNYQPANLPRAFRGVQNS